MAYALFLGTISFLLAVIWGEPLIRLLKRHHIGKKIRIEGPERHQVKMGTPTMGGLMIIIPVLLITLAANFVEILSDTSFGQQLLTALGVQRQAFFGRSILVPLGTMLAFGALGALDDWPHLRLVYASVSEEIFGVVGRILPPSAELLAFVDYTSSRILRRREALDGLGGSVQASFLDPYPSR